jgi:hypothetical protein
MIDYTQEKAIIAEIGVNEAKYLLDLNSKNRKPKNSVVAQYLNDIKNDRFKFNGSSIVVSNTGILLDGQHRLMALETSGNKKIKVVLVTGIKEETMETIDTGSKRTAGDVMTLSGLKNGNSISSIVKNVLDEFNLSRKNEYGTRTRTRITNTSTSKENIIIQRTNDEILNEYLLNKEIYDEAFEFGTHLYNNGVKITKLSPSVYASYYVLLSREDKQQAKNFLREIAQGIKLKECSSAISLRDKLINITIKRTSTTMQELRDMIVYYFRKYKDNKDVFKYNREQASFKKQEHLGLQK